MTGAPGAGATARVTTGTGRLRRPVDTGRHRRRNAEASSLQKKFVPLRTNFFWQPI